MNDTEIVADERTPTPRLPGEKLNGPEPRVTPEPQGEAEEAAERARVCDTTIRAALKQFHCRIVPVLVPEQVGTGPLTRMLLSTDYGVEPLAVSP